MMAMVAVVVCYPSVLPTSSKRKYLHTRKGLCHRETTCDTVPDVYVNGSGEEYFTFSTNHFTPFVDIDALFTGLA